MLVLHIFLLAALVPSVAGLPPTNISTTNQCSGTSCLGNTKFNFPETTYPVTPRFNFSITGSLPKQRWLNPEGWMDAEEDGLEGSGGSPTFNVYGSLGGPKHQLGIFYFNYSGPACGPQRFDVLDGVLATITMDFPACPWSGDVRINGHVDVWTTIPALPIHGSAGIWVGFHVWLDVFPAGVLPAIQDTLDTVDDTDPPRYLREIPRNTSPTCLQQLLADCGDTKYLTDCIACIRNNHKPDLKTAGCKMRDWRTFCKAKPSPPPTPPPPELPRLISLKMIIKQPSGKGAEKSQDTCNLDLEDLPQYPPPALDNITIPWVTIDLDEDPKTRWAHIVAPRAEAIADMIDVFIANLGVKNSTLLRAIMTLGGKHLLNKIPSNYADEIRGISKATGLDLGYLFIYNIMYEISGVCTSQVAQDSQGHIYHASNLDFGLFMGTDNATHNWALAPKLRDLLFNAQFVSKGKVLYNATMYAGYVGLLRGGKKGGFSLTVNTRMDGNVDRFLLSWLMGKFDGEFLGFKTRDAMENMETYNDAVTFLSSYTPMGPAYVILGGTSKGQGAVIALKAGKFPPLLTRTLDEALGNNSFYVLETNYDWPGPPPPFDDRRYPALNCMDKIGSRGLNYKTLWGMMSSNPTRNALTTFTTLMSAETGHFESYKQFCAPGPECVPF